MSKRIVPKPIAFNWDQHNTDKNWNRHKVDRVECEQAFFNKPRIFFEDAKHSQRESRYALLGKTNTDRKICIIFTLRDKHIRVISARDQSKKERRKYEEK